MWRSQERFVGTVLPVAGVRTDGQLKLTNGVRNEFITLTIRARVVVSAFATAVLRNRGSAFALLDEVILDESGTERMITTGPVLRYVSEMNARSALSSTRIVPAADGTIPIGTYNLEEQARFFFAWPESSIPGETAFVERDPRQALRVILKAVNNLALALATPNTATVVVDQVSVDIHQGFELGAGAPSLFIPTIRQTITPIVGAIANLPDYIRSPNRIRAVVFSQEVEIAAGGRVEVTDILTHLALRGDFQFPLGPERLPVANLALSTEWSFGGFTAGKRHLGFNFQKHGKLSHVLDPAQDTNMRAEYTGAASATAGQSQVRATYLELMQVPGLTAESRPF